jgi:hypothetical protein
MRIGSSSYWLFQVVGWGSFALVNVLLATAFEKMGDEDSRRMVFTRLGIFLVTGIAFTHLMRAVILRLRTMQKRLEIQFAQLLFISVIFSVIAGASYMKACLHFGILNEEEWRFADRPALLAMSGGFFFFVNIVIWNLIYFSYHYVIQSRKQQRDALKLQSLIKELEPEAMAS